MREYRIRQIVHKTAYQIIFQCGGTLDLPYGFLIFFGGGKGDAAVAFYGLVFVGANEAGSEACTGLPG